MQNNTMDIVLKNLQTIERCIKTNSYEEVETERFEVKDLSNGWGNDWYKSVCAFLNTNGGIIVIGINDKNNSKPPQYKFTGYDNRDENEKHLKVVLPKTFTDKDGNTVDVSQNLDFEIIKYDFCCTCQLIAINFYFLCQELRFDYLAFDPFFGTNYFVPKGLN